MLQPHPRYRSARRLSLSGRGPFVFLFLLALSALPALAAGSAPEPPASAPAATIITWRAADNPRVISGTYIIPAGTTVIMEAGVIVKMSSNSKIQVDGELVGQGTATKRVQINSSGNNTSQVEVNGTLNLKFTDIDVTVVPNSGNAELLFADCNFKGFGVIFTFIGYIFNTPAYLQFDRTSFDGPTAELACDNATVVLRDVSFTNGALARISYSYVYLDRVTSDRARNYGLSFLLDGSVYFNNLSVTNANGAGLVLGSGVRGGNYFLDSNVHLQNNTYPVSLQGGLLPGSFLPATGNVNNGILATGGGVAAVWGKMAVPYIVGSGHASLTATTIMPGVTVKMSPDTGIDAGSDYTVYDGMDARGTAAEPIIFQRLDASRPWFSVGFQSSGPLFEHVIVEGATIGVATANNAGYFVYVNDTILRNNATGSSGATFIKGTQYLNNTTGYATTGGLAATQGGLRGGPASPNSFVGNGVGISNSSRDAIPAQDNWWGSPTGPKSSTNPNGTGDSAEGGDVIPFLTTAPDYKSDTPPVVRWHKPFLTYDAGSRVTLSWNSEDDREVVAHRILFSKAGNFPDSFELVAKLPGTQRAFEWTVPNIQFQVTNQNAYLRVVAVDSAGHERWDDARIEIPTGTLGGTLTFTTDLAGRTFKIGEDIPLTYARTGDLQYESVSTFIQIDGEGFVGTQVPYVSTDTARYLVRVHNNGNHVRWFYTPYFKIRPDARVGDQPPTVTLVNPQSGASIAAGNSIPVQWMATDDESIRSYNLQISYDGGISWTMIARDLPATTTSYSVPTAPGGGYADVRLRIIAFDKRFQSSSDGAQRPFSIMGSSTPVNVDPVVSLTNPGTDSQFNAPATLLLTANASDSDGTVSRVDFYVDGYGVGTDTEAPYEFSWQNIPSGAYTLVAVATDNRGGFSATQPVNIKINALAPPPTVVPGALWAATYNGPSSRFEENPIMAVDNQGNVIISSSSTGVGTEADIATTKYDANGNQLWVVRYNGAADYTDYPADVAVDAQGNVYVTGSTWRELNYNNEGTEYDYVTLKYSAGGQLLWTKYYTGTQTPSWQDTPEAIEVDAAGNAYVTGMSYRRNSVGNLVGQYATIKYDSDGNQKWVRTFDSPQELGAIAKDLRVDANGFVYVTGRVTVAPSAGTLSEDIYTIKYDTNGNVIWKAQFDTPGKDDDFDNPNRLKLDAQGNVYIVGSNWPITEQRYDFLTLKYSNDGALKWSRNWRTPDDEGANDLAFDSQGNVIVTGGTTVSHNGGYPNTDTATVKYDTNGTQLWARIYNGPGNGEDGGERVVTDSAGNAYVGMSSQNTSTYDIAVARYAPDGTETVTRYNAPGSGGSDLLYDMAIDRAGNLYLTGTSNIPGHVLDVVTIKVATGTPRARRATVSDFDGDGITDRAVWHPADGNWLIARADGTMRLRNWGTSGDRLVPADYDADGLTDIAIFRPSEGNWYIIRSSDNTVELRNWGGGADVPVPADYDGDGRADIAVFRPSEGNWYIIRSSDNTVQFKGWGATGDVAVPGDYDGDGKTDVAVFRPAEGNWYVINSAGGNAMLKNWGFGGDRPVPGDYDGDGRTDFAVFRPAEGNWYILRSAGGNGISRNWGNRDDLPVPGDYDGDGKTDIAVWRPTEGTWYIISSGSGAATTQYLGVGGDVPVASAYVR